MGTSAGTTTTETGGSSTGEPSECGNGVKDAGEKCDDGTECEDDGKCNADAYTGKSHCNAECSGLYPGWCGNGEKEAEEACDAGGENAECDADCTAVECGDGVKNGASGEECDDGEENSDGYDDRPAEEVGCNGSCSGKAPHCGDGVCDAEHEGSECGDCKCGDGMVSMPGEACDGGVGGEPMDTMECDADCSQPECGDGHLNVAAGEACDDGNEVDTDECRNDCTTCGNGMVQEGEQCDDGNVVDDDGCSNECVAPRVVFVTSGKFDGNLGGLAGADAKCKAGAEAAKLPAATWLAWLSDGTGSPDTRFDKSFTGWYRLVDGTPVAKGWADLTDGTLGAAINVTESGQAVIEPFNVWSNTTASGTAPMNGDHCVNWNSPAFGEDGRFGLASLVDSNWTDADEGNPITCLGGLRLYCFQNSP